MAAGGRAGGNGKRAGSPERSNAGLSNRPPRGHHGRVISELILLVAAAVVAPGAEGVAAPAPALKVIDLVCVDERATGYATFQSHNQKVVENARGIFMTHLRTRNEEYTAQTWRLSRSGDRGQTWKTIFEATHATNPPVIETDAGGNLYLVRPDFADGHAYLYRFSAGGDDANPAVSKIPGAAAGKYALYLDPVRRQLY